MSSALGFCGRCGAPIIDASESFCSRCGNPIVAPPPVATGYSYPVVPAASVPAAQHKLSHLQLLASAGGIIAVVVIALTVILVVVKPGTKACHFSCGPSTGTRLLSPTAYTSTQFNFRVEYDSSSLKLGQQSATSVDLQAANGDGALHVAGSNGSNVTNAIQTAVNSIDSNTFQNIQQIGDIPGAQIGFVQGQGVALSAQLVPSDGSGQATPVTIMVMAASQNNVTITAVAFGAMDTSSAELLPFGLTSAQTFDFALTNTIWPGS